MKYSSLSSVFLCLALALGCGIGTQPFPENADMAEPTAGVDTVDDREPTTEGASDHGSADAPDDETLTERNNLANNIYYARNAGDMFVVGSEQAELINAAVTVRVDGQVQGAVVSATDVGSFVTQFPSPDIAANTSQITVSSGALASQFIIQLPSDDAQEAGDDLALAIDESLIRQADKITLTLPNTDNLRNGIRIVMANINSGAVSTGDINDELTQIQLELDARTTHTLVLFAVAPGESNAGSHPIIKRVRDISLQLED